MKTFPSYPTRHPNWIDAEPEPDNKFWRAGRFSGGLSFKWAFVIVLGLHVVLICGIYAAGRLKSRAPVSSAAGETRTTSDGPKSDALARNAWPQPEATPEVKALPPASKKAVSKTVPVAPKVVGRKPPAPQATPIAPPTPPAPPAPKPNDHALREKFLAARNANPPVKAAGGLQEKIPAPVVSQPGVVANAAAAVPFVAVAPAAPVTKNEAVQPTPPAVEVKEYTLGGGDNLYAVSRRLQVSYSDLMEANGITDPRQLRVGQKLKVPERKADSTHTL